LILRAKLVISVNLFHFWVSWNLDWWELQRERDCKEDQDVGGWIILGWILEGWDGVMWTGLVWLRIGTGGELL
jgi:hypothetical protein